MRYVAILRHAVLVVNGKMARYVLLRFAKVKRVAKVAKGCHGFVVDADNSEGNVW